MRGLLVTWLIVLSGCGASAPEIRVIQRLPSGSDPVIRVTAARQKEEIVRALRGAGFRIAEGSEETPYLLRVTIGVTQNERSCGSFANVRYALRSEKRDILRAEAKGWTGTCEPNVFDAVSRELRARVVEMIERRE